MGRLEWCASWERSNDQGEAQPRGPTTRSESGAALEACHLQSPAPWLLPRPTGWAGSVGSWLLSLKQTDNDHGEQTGEQEKEHRDNPDPEYLEEPGCDGVFGEYPSAVLAPESRLSTTLEEETQNNTANGDRSHGGVLAAGDTVVRGILTAVWACSREEAHSPIRACQPNDVGQARRAERPQIRRERSPASPGPNC